MKKPRKPLDPWRGRPIAIGHKWAHVDEDGVALSSGVLLRQEFDKLARALGYVPKKRGRR